jgi:hypothetical protein
MEPFFVADLDAGGGLLMKEQYTYVLLERVPGAIEIIAQVSGALYRSPETFEVRLDGSRLSLRWSATSDSSGIATMRFGHDLASLSFVVCGRNAETDASTLGAFQRHLINELKDTGYEPGFGLLEIVERPLLATINFRSPDESPEQLRLALADRCFAAAYFRQQGLA